MEGRHLGDEVRPSRKGALVFTGRTLGRRAANSTVALIDLDTGRTIATLEDPNQDTAGGCCFSPDGSQLVVATHESYSVHVWDLRRIRAGLKSIDLDWDAPPYPVPEAGPLKVRLVGPGLLDPVKLAEYQRGKAVFDLYVNPFDADAHLRLGTFLLGAGQLEPGHAHLTAALAFDPNLPKTSGQRVRAAFRLSGEAYLRQKRWKEAAADYVRLAEWEPQSTLLSMQAAALLLASEDREGYRRLGKEMLERFRNTTNPFEADQTAKTCLIASDFKEDQGPLAKLAEVAVAKGQPTTNPLQHFQFCRGLSEYRQGRYASALEWFAKSRKANAALKSPYSPHADLDALNGLFEAMALHHLDRTEEARRSLATAAEVIDKRFGVASADPRGNWHDWLFCQTARREAEAVLKAKPKPGPD